MQDETPGHRVRAKRMQLRISQVDLARRVGLTEQAINRIEVGNMPITMLEDPCLQNIAAELGTTTEYILQGEPKSERETREELYGMLKDGIIQNPEEFRRLDELARESIRQRNNTNVPLKRLEIWALLEVIRGADGY